MKNKYNEYAWIVGEPEIGEGTWIGAFTVIDGLGGLKIGKNCDISCGVHIYTHSTVKRCVSDKKFNEDGSINRDIIEKAPVNIGNNTFIGANAVVLMGVNIGECCVVGAGAVVTKDIPDFTVVAGVPAKLVGKVKIKNKQVEIEMVK